MEQSPCVNCEKFENFTPRCFKDCIELHEYQITHLSSNDLIRNYEYTNNEEYGNK
jgi:hypothetical protein